MEQFTVNQILEQKRTSLLQRRSELIAYVDELSDVNAELTILSQMLGLSYTDSEAVTPVEEPIVEPIAAPVIPITSAMSPQAATKPYVAQRMITRPQGRFRYG
tara:strand:- start:612 stop:920 length:309 start_codon:yes stop_codon:yes gene_type:complete